MTRARGLLWSALAVALLVVSIGAVRLVHNQFAPRPNSTVQRSGPEGHTVNRGTVQFGLAFGDTLKDASVNRLRTELGDVKDTGATWARVDLSWIDVQPVDADHFSWTSFDQLVAVVGADGVRLLVTLGYAPEWAWAPGCHVLGCAPADPAEFAAFARRAAARYGTRVAGWEIWNEPNTPGFWAPTPDATAFAALVKQSASAIRSVDKGAIIVTGGLAATTDTAGAIDTRMFLKQLCARGINRIVSAIGYHPYTYPYLASYLASFGTAWNKIAATPVSFESILRAAGTPDLPVWATEYGAPTSGDGTQTDGTAPIGPTVDHVTLGLQAKIASDVVSTALATRGVGALFWYSDRDGPTTTNVDHYGLRYADGRAKPAYWSWRDAVRTS